MGVTRFPRGLQGSPMVGANLVDVFQATTFANKVGTKGNIYFVDGDNGSDSNDGLAPDTPFATIGAALAVSKQNAVIYIKARNNSAGDTDPVNYAETITISPSQGGTKLIGVGSGLAQGGQPQIKKGSGSTSMITVQAPGCLIFGLTINMAGSTGGGVLLDDDGTTKSAFGTVIENCVFKGNANKTNLAGAIAWAATGGAWQVQIKACKFFDCATGINILGTTQAVPKDCLIQDCVFSSSANTNVDADIMTNAGTGVNGWVIQNCNFCTVDVPALAGGATARYLDMTQAVNSALVYCTFGCIGQGTGAKTFGAAGSGAKIPTTMRMAGNMGEVGATATTGEILRT